MPSTSLDAPCLPTQLRMGSEQVIAASGTCDAPSPLSCTAAQRAGNWTPQLNAAARDTRRGRDVLLVVGPGVYDVEKWWVRPLSGDCGGWLAARGDLAPIARRSS